MSRSRGIIRDLLIAGLSTFGLVSFLWASCGSYLLWKMDHAIERQMETRRLIRQDAPNLEREINVFLRQAADESRRTRQQLRTISAIILFFGFGLGAFVFYLFARSIVKPLIQLKEAAIRIGEGKWDCPIQIRARGEIGVLADAFCQMAAHLKKESALRSESQQRFEIVAQSTNDVVWDWNLVTNTIWWNEGMRSLFLYEAEDVGLDIEWWIERIHPEDRGRVIAGINRLLETGQQAWSGEYRFQRKNGGYATVFDRGSLIYDDQKRPIRMIGALIDTSDRKRLEAVVAQSEKMSVLGQFAAGVAHDINNPVGVILGFAQSVLRRLEGSDPLVMPLQSIEREALRCKTLVHDLLVFSRGGKPETVLAVEDVQLVIKEALTLIGTIARARKVELACQWEGSIPRAWVDRSQIQQIVINLCTNAMDAMPNGGRLTVGLTSHPDGFQIFVSDTGTGITPEVRARMFEAFFTTKEAGKGTGLGLSLVANIVNKHQGKIDVQSEAGKGSTFLITLPIAPPAVAEPQQAAA